MSGLSPEVTEANVHEPLKATFRRVTVLYHGTTWDKAELIQKTGLVGVRPTLSPDMQVSTGYVHRLNTRPVLTIWCPKKTDIDIKHRHGFQQAISRNITPAERIMLTDTIKNFDISEEKRRDILSNSDKFLPADRLKAIVILSPKGIEAISKFTDTLQSEQLFELYVNDRNILISQAKAILINSTMQYLAQDLSIEQLSYDMVTSAIEEELITLGILLKERLSSKTEDLKLYESIQRECNALIKIKFHEPIFERYRNQIIRYYKQAVSL